MDAEQKETLETFWQLSHCGVLQEMTPRQRKALSLSCNAFRHLNPTISALENEDAWLAVVNEALMDFVNPRMSWVELQIKDREFIEPQLGRIGNFEQNVFKTWFYLGIVSYKVCNHALELNKLYLIAARTLKTRKLTLMKLLEDVI